MFWLSTEITCPFQSTISLSVLYAASIVFTVSASGLFMPPRKKRGADDLWNHDELPVAASTLELSRDGKRVRWDTAQVQPAAPLPAPIPEPAGIEAPEYFAEDSALPYDTVFPLQDSPDDTPPLEKVKVLRKRYLNSVSLLSMSLQSTL